MSGSSEADAGQVLHGIPRPVFISYARRNFRIAYKVAYECILTDGEREALGKQRDGLIQDVLTLDVPPPHQLPPDMKLEWMHAISSTADHPMHPPGVPGFEDDWSPGMPGWMFGIGGEMIRAKSLVVIVTPHAAGSPAVAKEVEAFSVFADKPIWLVSVNGAPAPSEFFELPEVHTAVARVDMDGVLGSVLRRAGEYEEALDWYHARRMYAEAIDLAALRNPCDATEALQLIISKGRMEVRLGWCEKAVESFRDALSHGDLSDQGKRAVLLYNLGMAHLTDAHDRGCEAWTSPRLLAAHDAWREALEITASSGDAPEIAAAGGGPPVRSFCATMLEWMTEFLGASTPPADDTEGHGLDLQAADQGDADAQYRLGLAYLGGGDTRRDDRAAAEWLLRAAEQGHPAAQFRVGFGYETGLGLLQIDEKALHWYGASAQQGFALAQYRLAGMLGKKEGADENPDSGQSLALYRAAAREGHAGAQLELGARLYDSADSESQRRQAIGWIEAAAEQDLQPAQCLMAKVRSGALGEPVDLEAAARWYRRAALLGDVEAQKQRASLCRTGTGVPVDFGEAATWYRRAADQGDAESQWSLGLLHLQGNGVDRSDTAAALWTRLAAEQGYGPAQNTLGELYADGVGVPQSDGEALRWFGRSAEQGVARGQFNLGLSYGQGRGVERDGVEGVRWLQKAARQNLEPAVQMLQKLGLARIDDAELAARGPDDPLSGRHLLWVLHDIVSRLEDSRGLQGCVCVGLRTEQGHYLIWRAEFSESVEAGFVTEWPPEADATLFIGEAEALSALQGHGIPADPDLFSIDGDRELVRTLWDLLDERKG